LIFADGFFHNVARSSKADSQSFQIPKLLQNIDANGSVVFSDSDPISKRGYVGKGDHLLNSRDSPV
jgi:hypothetical protein